MECNFIFIKLEYHYRYEDIGYWVSPGSEKTSHVNWSGGSCFQFFQMVEFMFKGDYMTLCSHLANRVSQEACRFLMIFRLFHCSLQGQRSKLRFILTNMIYTQILFEVMLDIYSPLVSVCSTKITWLPSCANVTGPVPKPFSWLPGTPLTLSPARFICRLAHIYLLYFFEIIQNDQHLFTYTLETCLARYIHTAIPAPRRIYTVLHNRCNTGESTN